MQNDGQIFKLKKEGKKNSYFLLTLSESLDSSSTPSSTPSYTPSSTPSSTTSLRFFERISAILSLLPSGTEVHVCRKSFCWFTAQIEECSSVKHGRHNKIPRTPKPKLKN